MSKKFAFVLILSVFVLLYASLTLDLPLLGKIGIAVYIAVACMQAVKVKK